MCKTTPHRHSILCILPPYMLESLVQKGTPQQRAWALKTLSVDNAFRALRALPRLRLRCEDVRAPCL